MNTRASVVYGWGVLIAAGAGSYFFAKRSINKDREERAQIQERRRQEHERLRMEELNSQSQNGDGSPDPSRTVDGDPAPVKHVDEKIASKSKYEATEPFRSRKGDRFSSF